MRASLLTWFSLLLACDDFIPGGPPMPPPPAAAPAPLLAPVDAIAPPPPPELRDDGRDLRARLRAMRAGDVPQLDGAFELFEEAEGTVTPDALDGGLLLCDVRVSPASRADTYKGPDLTLLVRAGELRGHLRGAEDTWAWTMSMPLASLRDADALWARVVDRDTWEDEIIGERSAALRALPLRLRMRHARVECRGLPRSRIAARAERAARELDTHLAQVTRTRPDAALAGFGYPRVEVEAALDHVLRLVAWVGWHDRLLEERAARLVVWELGFRQQTRQIVEDLAAALPPPTELTPVRPGVEARAVEQIAGVLRLEVAGATGPAADPAAMVFEVVDREGTARRATLIRSVPGEWTLALPPSPGPLLRIAGPQGRASWLRLE